MPNISGTIFSSVVLQRLVLKVPDTQKFVPLCHSWRLLMASMDRCVVGQKSFFLMS